jgi:hypothetical protein
MVVLNLDDHMRNINIERHAQTNSLRVRMHQLEQAIASK